jgi:hypothetical protein
MPELFDLMLSLQLFRLNQYSRQEVHGIFAPDTPFTPQAGTWGLAGVVRIPERPGDWAFFVTLGQSQGEHTFEEGITDSGVLTWQSQPSQTLDDSRVIEWINHNELTNSIYLFFRTGRGQKYAFLGRLKYLTHDKERERPVYFQWQIIDWEPSPERLSELGIVLSTTSPAIASSDRAPETSGAAKPALVETSVPESVPITAGETTRTFQARKSPDYSAKDAADRQLGFAAELAVLEREKNRLEAAGRKDLAEKIVHVSKVEGDGAGYDIRSFDTEGRQLFLEVKATRGNARTPFFMSANELAFANRHPEQLVIVRVYDFRIEDAAGSFFQISGDRIVTLQFEAISYRVKI